MTRSFVKVVSLSWPVGVTRTRSSTRTPPDAWQVDARLGGDVARLERQLVGRLPPEERRLVHLEPHAVSRSVAVLIGETAASIALRDAHRQRDG